MGFTYRGLDTTTYEEESLETERLLVISCEGSNTEPEYFETIKEKLHEYISVLLEIKVIPKEAGASEPQDVVCNLEAFIEEEYDYQSDYDEMWVVWDREKVESRKQAILDILPECREKNYNIALTNPLFEFWLLLHIADISTYDNELLLTNEKLGNKQKFIDKELVNLLEKGYSKKKNKFNRDIVSIENIQRALKQEKLFENELEQIIDNLGSNVGDLIREILNFEESVIS